MQRYIFLHKTKHKIAFFCNKTKHKTAKFYYKTKHDVIQLFILEMFDYRTNIPAWLLVAVGALILLFALLTVGWQAIRAATANPVDSIMNCD